MTSIFDEESEPPSREGRGRGGRAGFQSQLSRPLSRASAEKTLLYQLAISGVALTLAAAAVGEPAPLAWSWRLAGLLGFQTVIVSFASYLLWFWMIRRYPATRLASFTLATPLFGLLAGALLLGEPVTPRLVAALVALAAGVLMVNQ